MMTANQLRDKLSRSPAKEEFQEIMTEKINKAILRIKHAYEIARQMGNELVLAYSGGKDSDLLLDLAIKSGVPFTVQHNHTTVDAPETVYHIRNVFKRLEAQDIQTKINYPPMLETADGKQTRATMWNLIPKKKIPPTRLVRYCCEYFKERHFDNQHILLGVRWAESNRRKKTRGLHETIGKPKKDKITYLDENDASHKLIDICHSRARIATNPIIDWTDADVWCYIKAHGLIVNPLYSLGFKRVGCIGCPMAGKKGRDFEFQMYPKYRAAYIRTFEKMVDHRSSLGKDASGNWRNGETVMDWWMERVPPNATN